MLGGQLQQLEAYLVHPCVNQPQLPRYAIGYINFAPFLIRTAVIYTYQLKFTGSRVDHPQNRSKRQVRVSGCQGFAVEALAVGGLFAVKRGSIPARVAYPTLNRLNRCAQVRNERGIHYRSDEEH